MLKTKKAVKATRKAPGQLRGNARRVAELAEKLRQQMDAPVTGYLWHLCHWHEGCGKKVQSGVLLCRKHWESVPASDRARTLNHYVKTLDMFGDVPPETIVVDMSGLKGYVVGHIAGCRACKLYPPGSGR
jgi:hypothetical protein